MSALTHSLGKLGAAAWADQLDFIGPRVRTSAWGWLALLVGMSVLAVQLDDYAAAEAEHAQAQDNLRRLQRAQHQASLAHKALESAARKPEGLQATLTPDGYQHAAQLAQWLSYDWAGVWHLVESQASQDKALITGFSLDLGNLGSREGVFPELQLRAVVLDDAAALQWASHMGPGAQLKARETLPAPVLTGHGNYTHKVDLVMVQEFQP